MRCTWLIALGLIGCGPDVFLTEPGLPPGDATILVDAQLFDTAVGADVSWDAGPDGETATPDPLIFEGPRRLLPGRPTLIGVRRAGGRSEVLGLDTPTGPAEVRLHRGRGVMLVEPDARAESGGPDGRPVVAFDPADPRDLRITEDLRVPAGETLRWPAGARVMIAPGVTIVIEGRLEAAGTEAEPILVTRATSSSWGTIEVRGEAVLDEVWLTAGGAGEPRYGGHSASNPALAVLGGSLTMRGGAIADHVGKALYAERAAVDLEGVIIARADTGGEYVESTVAIDGCHVVEIPDADGRFDDDDNDGSYFRLGTARVEGSVFALGEDDGLDHNGAELVVVDTIVEGFRHEGIACSNGGSARIEGTLVRAVAQGIECGYGAPAVEVVRSLVTGAGVGVRWGDEYEWESLGTLVVRESVIAGNEVDLDLVDPQQGAAPEGAVTVSCTATGQVAGLDPVGCLHTPAQVEGCEAELGWLCEPTP